MGGPPWTQAQFFCGQGSFWPPRGQLRKLQPLGFIPFYLGGVRGRVVRTCPCFETTCVHTYMFIDLYIHIHVWSGVWRFQPPRPPQWYGLKGGAGGRARPQPPP